MNHSKTDADTTDNTTEVDIDALTGLTLAWAVTRARGLTPATLSGFAMGSITYRDEGHGSWVSVCLDERECAEIQDTGLIGVERPSRQSPKPVWRAIADFRGKAPAYSPVFVVDAVASDRKTAIFRCFVKSIFHKQVHVPTELIAREAEADQIVQRGADMIPRARS